MDTSKACFGVWGPHHYNVGLLKGGQLTACSYAYIPSNCKINCVVKTLLTNFLNVVNINNTWENLYVSQNNLSVVIPPVVVWTKLPPSSHSGFKNTNEYFWLWFSLVSWYVVYQRYRWYLVSSLTKHLSLAWTTPQYILNLGNRSGNHQLLATSSFYKMMKRKKVKPKLT